MRLCTVTAHRTGRIGGTPSGGRPMRSVVRALSDRWPLAMLAILFALAAPAPTATAEETTVASQHGDWQKVCKRPAGASEDLCALVQDVTSESNPNVGLSVHFQRTPAGERVLRVFAPLGILLPPGLGLQIDEQKIGHAPFVRCHVVGCFAQVTLTDDLVARFKAGQTAWFIVFQTQEAGIGIPISLSGFSEAMASLETQ